MTWPREYYQQFELILASSRHTASLPPALPLASSPSLFLTVCLLFLFFLSLSLCSCITLSASLSQSLYTVCYSLAPPPFLPPICIPSLQKRPLKVNVCFHLRSSFSLPVPSCVYLHQTVSQVFPSSYGYPVWLHAHLFFFLTLPHPHGLKSHSDVKRKEEKEEAEEKYGTADAIIQTHTRIVEKLHRIHTRQS